MDTQDNLLIVKVGELVTSFPLNSIPDQVNLFSFKENETCILSLRGEGYEVISECHEEYESEDQNCQVILKQDMETPISDIEYPLCPAFYLLIIRNRKTSKEVYAHFEVKPLSSLCGNLYNNLRHVLNQRAPSCLFERSSDSQYGHTKEEYVTVHDLANKINDHAAMILSSLHRASLHPISDIRKKVIVGEGKENQKSMKRQILNPNTTFTYKTDEEMDNDENLYLFSILKQSKEKLLTLEESLALSSSSDETESENLFSTITPKETEKKERLTKKASQLLKAKTETDKTRKRIHQIVLAIDEFLNHASLSSSTSDPGRITQRFLMNHDYVLLYRKLYLPLQGEIGPVHHRYKPTAKLYEIYCLLSLIDTLKNMGFQEKKNDQIQKLDVKDQNLTFEFENQDYRAYLLYDQPVIPLRKIKEKKQKHCLVSLNSKHNRPDFQILFLDKRDVFRYGIVLDAKCRTKTSMMNYGKFSSGNKCTETILDYLQFRYPDASKAIEMSLGTQDLVLLAPLDFPEVWDESFTGIHVLSLTPGMTNTETYAIRYLSSLMRRALKPKGKPDFGIEPI